ncbi:hypothetical protein [Streptomyces xylophagus]|uniref:hypothetical protein n=1 Tax=Streptomyces xylophagus TaxID=285514 RepID=UPI000B04E043|nr:hypothetical protein [Streptomyces xylophagus]
MTGRPVRHHGIDPEVWIGGAVGAGLVLADYAVLLRRLTGSVSSGDGSTPNDDIEKVTGRSPAGFHNFARRNRTRLGRTGGGVTITVDLSLDLTALDPFFRIVQEGLAGLVSSTAWSSST